MSDLFDHAIERGAAAEPGQRPLADRLRPARIEDVLGQDHLLREGGVLHSAIRERRIPSLLLWGPPGVGKTTLARLLSSASDMAFEQVSAIFSGVGDLKKIFDAAKMRRASGQGTLLFVDEIHRFNKAQLDSFLPQVESGMIVLVGATTENPSFELTSALLSRMQVLELHALDRAALEVLLARAEETVGALPLDAEAREALIRMADGDGRALVNLVEDIAQAGEGPFDAADLMQRFGRRLARYDKTGDQHYGLISALHKAVRASDADAALYWLARMLSAGEDPLYISRRMIRMASEDIGLADPAALGHTIAADEAYRRLGKPEGELALAEAALYLALAPKSNAAYVAWKEALSFAEHNGALAPQRHSVNASTRVMKDLGFSDGYIYDHDMPDGVSGQGHFPEGVARETFYAPVDRGFERDLAKRVAWLERRRIGGPPRNGD